MIIIIYDSIMEELKQRNVYKHEIYAPYYICSHAIHTFNLFNQKHKIYWESKRLPNMRLHVLFVAPPGFMKSFYLGTMGGDDFSVYAGSNLKIGYEGSMTEAGLVGTINDIGNGIVDDIDGAAKIYNSGFLLIDEFSALSNALKVNYNCQMDTQMLSVLDSGYVNKRLAKGKIEYRTNMSLWAGVQPARYDLSSGLGRRLCFMVFLPTKTDNEVLMDVMHENRNIKPDVVEMEKLWSDIRNFQNDVNRIEHVEFPNDLKELYHKLDLASYESPYFDRIVLGYNLAKYGVEKRVEIEYHDKELFNILDREKEWRDSITEGIDYKQLQHMILMNGGEISKKELVQECILIGWNAQQVFELLGEMKKYEMVAIKGNMISVI